MMELVEDARGAVLAGEHAVLVRQVHAGRVHEIDDRDALAHRDLLRAQDLLDRLRPPGTRLDRGVVRDDHRGPCGHAAQARDDPGSGRLALVLGVWSEQAAIETLSSGVDALWRDRA